MRKCIRCGSEMKENCTITIDSVAGRAGRGIILYAETDLIGCGKLGRPKVAVCPQCGEISLYIENLDELND